MNVHLQSRQDNKIQLVDQRALVKRAGILSGTDPEMAQVFYGFHRRQIKILGIQKCINLIINQKITHGFCQTANTKSHPYPPLFHNLCE